MGVGKSGVKNRRASCESSVSPRGHWNNLSVHDGERSTAGQYRFRTKNVSSLALTATSPPLYYDGFSPEFKSINVGDLVAWRDSLNANQSRFACVANIQISRISSTFKMTCAPSRIPSCVRRRHKNATSLFCVMDLRAEARAGSRNVQRSATSLSEVR